MFSIVIPTYNRMDALPEVLAALEAQEGLEDQDLPAYELVIVDDGSTDGTGEWLQAREWTIPARVLRQDNQGPAAARNAGVRAADGAWVAFLGDDTVPQAGWLAAHRRAHAERGDDPWLAVLGYTRWHRDVRVTPFLDYINEHGLQFGYALIEDPEDVPFNFFYTSNVSLPRKRLLEEPFDLSFPYAAWEDTELSYRLTDQGLRLVYDPRAVTAHNHPTTVDRFMERQEKAGYSAVVFHRLHPELGPFLGLGPEGPPPVPSRGRQRLREVLVRALQHLPVRTPRLWDETLRYHYVRGLHRGVRDRAGTIEEATS